MCDQCENIFKKENDFNIHMDKMHDGKKSFENTEQLDGHVSQWIAIPKDQIKCMNLLRKKWLLHTSQPQMILTMFFRIG